MWERQQPTVTAVITSFSRGFCAFRTGSKCLVFNNHQVLGWYVVSVYCLAGIAHPDAGDGLWLRGTAPVGAVVGLYPGLVYEPMHYR